MYLILPAPISYKAPIQQEQSFHVPNAGFCGDSVDSLGLEDELYNNKNPTIFGEEESACADQLGQTIMMTQRIFKDESEGLVKQKKKNQENSCTENKSSQEPSNNKNSQQNVDNVVGDGSVGQNKSKKKKNQENSCTENKSSQEPSNNKNSQQNVDNVVGDGSVGQNKSKKKKNQENSCTENKSSQEPSNNKNSQQNVLCAFNLEHKELPRLMNLILPAPISYKAPDRQRRRQKNQLNLSAKENQSSTFAEDEVAETQPKNRTPASQEVQGHQAAITGTPKVEPTPKQTIEDNSAATGESAQESPKNKNSQQNVDNVVGDGSVEQNKSKKKKNQENSSTENKSSQEPSNNKNSQQNVDNVVGDGSVGQKKSTVNNCEKVENWLQSSTKSTDGVKSEWNAACKSTRNDDGKTDREPELCEEFVRGCCKAVHCTNVHYEMPYMWQFKENDRYWLFD